ncbi:hypothetical protein HMI54_003276 [Coelomomyces lativittatus]|nr:hypothetical protein HMI56_007330 [Coelomomyces lativittatus]KAJ1509969.1 hypothetical protein HMI55_007185 [Coelomomyces lativittatus]KAJ1517939.1 hypothetical protein HMI54_003276 [Coelomomyces lativittatus]
MYALVYLFALCLCFSIYAEPEALVLPTKDFLQDTRLALLKILNEERKKNQKQPFLYNGELETYAQLRTKFQAFVQSSDADVHFDFNVHDRSLLEEISDHAPLNVGCSGFRTTLNNAEENAQFISCLIIPASKLEVFLGDWSHCGIGISFDSKFPSTFYWTLALTNQPPPYQILPDIDSQDESTKEAIFKRFWNGEYEPTEDLKLSRQWKKTTEGKTLPSSEVILSPFGTLAEVISKLNSIAFPKPPPEVPQSVSEGDSYQEGPLHLNTPERPVVRVPVESVDEAQDAPEERADTASASTDLNANPQAPVVNPPALQPAPVEVPAPTFVSPYGPQNELSSSSPFVPDASSLNPPPHEPSISRGPAGMPATLLTDKYSPFVPSSYSTCQCPQSYVMTCT